MVQIIETATPEAFDKSIDSFGRRILMDGWPRQNSKKTLKALEDIGALVFKIPPRSPDLNPIENFFALVTKTLRKQVIEENIVRETRRSSRPEVFLGKGVLEICSKFTGEHPCRSAISIKLLCNFIKMTLRHGCSPVNWLHIFRTQLFKRNSGWLLWKKRTRNNVELQYSKNW